MTADLWTKVKYIKHGLEVITEGRERRRIVPTDIWSFDELAETFGSLDIKISRGIADNLYRELEYGRLFDKDE